MARNNIDKDELENMLLNFQRVPDEDAYCNADIGKVVSGHYILLREMAAKCPNVTAKFIQQAAKSAYKLKPFQAKLFGDRIRDALAPRSHCQSSWH